MAVTDPNPNPHSGLCVGRVRAAHLQVFETEGLDRDSLRLQGKQQDLVLAAARSGVHVLRLDSGIAGSG